MDFKRYYRFEIGNESWRVKEIFQIKWRSGGTSYDYTLQAKSKQKRYLEVFRKDKNVPLAFWLYEKVSPINKPSLVFPRSSSSPDFSKTITYQKIEYVFETKNRGSSFSSHFESEKVESFTYKQMKGEKLLVMERWNGSEVEFFTGKALQPSEISASKSSIMDMIRCYLSI